MGLEELPGEVLTRLADDLFRAQTALIGAAFRAAVNSGRVSAVCPDTPGELLNPDRIALRISKEPPHKRRHLDMLEALARQLEEEPRYGEHPRRSRRLELPPRIHRLRGVTPPGRKHRARPGDPTCPAEGCQRPAGFATDHEGAGACPADDTTTDAPAPRTRPRPDTRRRAGRTLAAQRVKVLRLVLLSCGRQAVPFEDAWRITVPVALHGLGEEDATGLLRDLRAREASWRDSYGRALAGHGRSAASLAPAGADPGSVPGVRVRCVSGVGRVALVAGEGRLVIPRRLTERGLGRWALDSGRLPRSPRGAVAHPVSCSRLGPERADRRSDLPFHRA